MDSSILPGKSAAVLLATGEQASAHERHVHQLLGEKIAALLGIKFAGVHEGSRVTQPELYVIPDTTLVAPQPAISTDSDLFGGVVPQSFMATKAISHPLVSEGATAPTGWTERFMELAGKVVLPGFSAFDMDDTLRAGQLLLRQGPLRAKDVLGRAGRGQQVIQSLAELEAWLEQHDAAVIRQDGVVLEQNLRSVKTYSVGQVRIGAITASYFGSQNLTRANDGEEVYGGSDLWIVRGDYAALLQQMNQPVARQAILQAQRYEQAAEVAFPGFIASRRNCDVAVGIDPTGRQLSGVLEQSWRIGGASSAEIHAVEAFAVDPSLQRLQASSWEAYGDAPDIPPGVSVLHQGDAPSTGPITIGVRISPWQQPAKPSN